MPNVSHNVNSQVSFKTGNCTKAAVRQIKSYDEVFDYINPKSPLGAKTQHLIEIAFKWAFNLPSQIFIEATHSIGYLYSSYSSYHARKKKEVLLQYHRTYEKFDGHIRRRLKPMAQYVDISVSYLKSILRELRECGLLVRIQKGGRTNASHYTLTSLGTKLSFALINRKPPSKNKKILHKVLHKKDTNIDLKREINTPQSASNVHAEPPAAPQKGVAEAALSMCRSLLSPQSG